jgi:hypothetical protein
MRCNDSGPTRYAVRLESIANRRPRWQCCAMPFSDTPCTRARVMTLGNPHSGGHVRSDYRRGIDDVIVGEIFHSAMRDPVCAAWGPHLLQTLF